MRALEHCSRPPYWGALADPARWSLQEPPPAGGAAFPRWTWRPVPEPARAGGAVFPRWPGWLLAAPLRPPENRRNRQEKEDRHPRATVPESETCGCRDCRRRLRPC